MKLTKAAFTILLLLACALLGSVSAALVQPQLPAKLFDVRNGNAIVDSGVTYPRATVIIFKDNASKDAMIDAFAAEYNYHETINGAPNPQSKQAFMNTKITAYLKDVYKASQGNAAAKTAKQTADTASDAALP